MNKPYIKQIDSLGRVQNPITKENPYQSRVFLGMQKDETTGNEYPIFHPNRKERRAKKPRFKARYGKQFIQTVYTFKDFSGNVIKQNDVINHVNLTTTKKQIVHTRTN